MAAKIWKARELVQGDDRAVLFVYAQCTKKASRLGYVLRSMLTIALILVKSSSPMYSNKKLMPETT